MCCVEMQWKRQLKPLSYSESTEHVSSNALRCCATMKLHSFRCQGHTLLKQCRGSKLDALLQGACVGGLKEEGRRAGQSTPPSTPVLIRILAIHSRSQQICSPKRKTTTFQATFRQVPHILRSNLPVPARQQEAESPTTSTVVASPAFWQNKYTTLLWGDDPKTHVGILSLPPTKSNTFTGIRVWFRWAWDVCLSCHTGLLTPTTA